MLPRQAAFTLRKQSGNISMRTYVRMGRKIHDWAAIQRYYDLGHGFVQCQKRFGFSHTAWIKAIKRGELLVAGTPFADRRRKYRLDRSAAVLRRRAYATGNAAARSGSRAARGAKAVDRGELRARARRLPTSGRVSFTRIAQREAPLAGGWYTRKSLRLVWLNRMEGPAPFHSNRPHQRRAGTITASRTFGCSAQTVTVKRRLSEQKISAKIDRSRVAQLAERLTLNQEVLRSIRSSGATALSSRGLGRRPLTAVTRVRIPLGLPLKTSLRRGFLYVSRVGMCRRDTSPTEGWCVGRPSQAGRRGHLRFAMPTRSGAGGAFD